MPVISTFNTFPSRYKICALQINLSYDQTIINRQTYDLLLFLGDVGGLNGALVILGAFLVGWFSVFNAESFIVTTLYVQSSAMFQNVRSLLKNEPV